MNVSQQNNRVLTTPESSTHYIIDFIINILTPINCRFGIFRKIDSGAMKRKIEEATLKGIRQPTPP